MKPNPPIKDRVPADPIDVIDFRPMSYETFLDFDAKLENESRKMEWVDDTALIYMSASTKHQSVLVFLVQLFGLFVNRVNMGKMFTDPFLCKLWTGGPAREPDIVVITPDNAGTLDDQRFYGAPDLVVEIISPGSVRQDNFKKFAEYEQSGVREYWVIDPRRHYQTTHLYQLNENGEFDAVSPDEDGRLYSMVLPNFWLQNEWLWESTLPEPLLKFAEIMLTVPTLSDESREMYQALYNMLSAQ